MAHGIELAEDMRFQRGEWRVQRVGWVVMGLILVAAVLGYSGGPGLLTRRVWGQKGGSIWVEGTEVERHHRPTEMEVRFGPGVGKDGRVEFWVDGDFLDKMELKKVVPEPVEMRREGGRVVMVLKAGPGTGLQMQLVPSGFGWARGRMGVVGGGKVEVKQFLMP